MLKRIYHYATLFLERRPWGIHLLYHSIRHYKIYEFIEAVLVAFFFAMVIRTFFIQAFKIPSESMVPTLQVGDRLFVWKPAYHLGGHPEIGDIAVFRTPDNIYDPRRPIYIKRVVGLSGDRVAIQGGKLYVNGQRVTHPVISANEYTMQVFNMNRNPKLYTAETVPEGEVYMFGDNSPYSLDSRSWGGVPLENFKGKAVIRWWPLDSRLGFLE
jgi:signal peptidase I